MARRKTVSVDSLRKTVNERNRVSVCDGNVRRGWNSLLTLVLQEANQYAGFRCLRKEEVPTGCLPGIQTDQNGEPLPYDDRFVNTDDSRVNFY